MSRPLRINNTSPISLREMSDADIEYITYRVLYEFANTQSGTGTLNFDGIGTNIGSFVDTSRPYNVGQHPVGTNINTNTITFYQNRLSTTINPSARPVIWNGSSLQEISNSELNDVVLFNSGIKLTSGGIGSYYLSNVSPTGGSWIEIGSFIDSSAGGDEEYTLFRKVNDTSPPPSRPLKTVSGGLREMIDIEIESLVDNFREYIRTTGVGFYALQSSAPTNGTYIISGSEITDTRNQIANISYTGTASYTGTRDFTGTRTFTAFFSGRVENYTGTREFTGTRTFTGTASYVGTTVLSTKETISTRSLWVRQS